MPLIDFDTDTVLFGDDIVLFGPLDEELPEVPAEFQTYRNGELVEILWSRSQLLSISLGIAAYDGEIANGSVTLPGVPDRTDGWWIGDRISFVDPVADTVLYTGYLQTPTLSRNPDAPTELQTTWTLVDINRQLIGRRVADQEFPLTYSLDDLVGGFQPLIEGSGDPQPTVDDVTWVDTDGTPLFPAKTYNSDGAADWIADIVKYTGKTVYLGLTDVENALELHVHALTSGPAAGLSVSDDPDDFDEDVVPPSKPTQTLETADLKDGVTGRNGVDTVLNSPVGTYSDGGLGWEASLDFGGSQNDLVLLTNNAITNGVMPRSTYGGSLVNLTGAQVAKARAGSLIPLTSAVYQLMNTAKRISRLTLTVNRDIAGNPRPGFWDIALEMDFPLRNPTAILGFGGQGSALGALSTYTTWADTVVTEDDPGIPVGSFETVTAQLVDDKGFPVPIADVNVTWGVFQPDKTTFHPDYETYLDDETTTASITQTDQSGQAHIVVKRIASTIAADHCVQAGPV